MDRRTKRSAEQLGEHVRNWRKLLNLTAQQVCERAGISRGTLHRLETGDTVGTDTLLAVARALGQVDNLLSGIDPWESDIGRLRSEESLPKRVRHRRDR